MEGDWSSDIKELDGDIFVTIKHSGMKKFKVSRSYHVDTDELVIEITKTRKEPDDGGASRREVQEIG